MAYDAQALRLSVAACHQPARIVHPNGNSIGDLSGSLRFQSYHYSGLHLNEKTAGKDARAPSSIYFDYSSLLASENRCNTDADCHNDFPP